MKHRMVAKKHPTAMFFKAFGGGAVAQPIEGVWLHSQ
jgi:hypothetical protein